MTVNPKISIQQSGKPPPLYVCLDCADALNRLDFDQLIDILLPTKQVSLKNNLFSLEKNNFTLCFVQISFYKP